MQVKNEITGNLFRVFRGYAENYSFTSEKGKVLFTDVETEEKAIEKAKKYMRDINQLKEKIEGLDIDISDKSNFAEAWKKLGKPDESKMEVAWDMASKEESKKELKNQSKRNK